MATVNRPISSFDARSRQILTNGGTVRGGNGILYRYDPNTGMAVNANARPTAGVTAPPRDTTPGPYRRTADRGPTTAPDPLANQPTTAGPTTGLPTGTPHHRMPEGASGGHSGGGAGAGSGPGAGVSDGPLAPVTAPHEDAAKPTEEVEDPLEKSKREADEKLRRDAYARLQQVLNDYGLGSLAQTVQTWLIEGLSEAEIVQRMRETTEFKTRFPGIEERKKKGLAPISPGEYVAYERSARQMMRAAGLPEGFYDSNEDFTKFLVNDLSLAELGDRVTLAANAAFKMPREDRDALAAWGMGPGDLTAFWLDPDKAQPLLERKYAAAQLAGASTRSGWGSLDEGRATGLATLGVNSQQAEQGFGQLAQSRELFTALDRGEDVISQDEQLDAAFRGNSAAQRRIANRARRRQAQFEGGGSFASSQQGLVGLGSVDE